MSESTANEINRQRVGFAYAYLLLFLALLVVCLCFKKKVFYWEMWTGYHYWRFLWCVTFSVFGFAVLSFCLRRHKSSPWPLHVFYYPPMLLAISALVFAACHIFEATATFVFYYLSAAACFILAFLVDSFWGLVRSRLGAN